MFFNSRGFYGFGVSIIYYVLGLLYKVKIFLKHKNHITIAYFISFINFIL